jgi:hypothetical protein
MRRVFGRKHAPVQEETTTTTTTTSLPGAPTTAAVVAETRIEQVELPREIRERPAVVHETIRREEVEEIQPVIHRERDTTEVRQLTQPIYEQEVRSVQIHEQTLPAEQRAAVIYEAAPLPAAPLPTSSFAGVERRVVEKPPVVVETIKRLVIEETQPIIYKEIHEPHIIRVTKPIYERVVEAPVVYQETLAARETFRPMQYAAPLREEVTTTTSTTSTGPVAGATGASVGRGFHGHHHHRKSANLGTTTTVAPVQTTAATTVTETGVRRV